MDIKHYSTSDCLSIRKLNKKRHDLF